jgi:hypothetical protein
MRRSALFAPLALAALLLAPPPARAQFETEPSHFLPAGRTLGYLEVADWKHAEAAIHTTDLGQAWRSLEPFVKHIRAGVDAQLAEQKSQFQEQFGVKADDLLALLEGGFALAAVDTAPPDGQPQIMPVAVFPAGAKATIAALVETIKKKQGEQAPPVYLVDRPGAVVVTLDQNAIVASGAAGALADDAQFQATRAKVLGQGGPIFFAYEDMTATFARIRDPQEVGNFEKLGVTGVKAIGLGLGTEAGRIREGLAVAAPGEKKGLLKILASGRPLELAKVASAVPAGAMAFSAIRFDARGLLDQVTELARAFNPDADKDMAEGMKQFEQQFGLRLKEDVLDPLGDLVTMESVVPEDGLFPETVFAIDVKDGVKVQQTLAVFASRAGFEVATVERGGRKIQYLLAPLGKLGQDPMAGMNQDQVTAQAIMTAIFGAWTVEQGRLYFSQMPQALEERFERLEKGTLASSEAWSGAVAQAPQGARMFAWQKTRGTIGVVYDLGMKVLKGAEPYARRAGVAVDTALLPRPSQLAGGMKPTTFAVTAGDDGFFILSQGGLPILTTVPVIAAAGAFAYERKRASADREMAAMQVEFDLRTLSYAESNWKAQKGTYTGSMDDLVQSGQIDQDFTGHGLRAGYRYEIQRADADHFTIVARPLAPGKAVLMVDETMDVRPYGAPSRRQGGEASPGGEDEGMAPPPPPPAGDSGGAPAGSDDDHKLYQAAAMTGDQDTIIAMYKKIGLMKPDGSIDVPRNQKFVSEHQAWAMKNVQFIQDIQDPAKAKEYWEAHR